MSKVCGNCKFAVLEDFGYSNYTVEGTSFSCAKRAHPDGTFDNFYGEDKRLTYAEKCPSFEEGDPVSIDVDCEEVEHLSDEQKAIYQLHCEATHG